MESLKKKLVQSLAIAANMDMLKDNKVIITTALGIISGKLCDDQNADNDNMSETLLRALTDQVVDSYGSDNIDGNDGFLLLSDVSIRTGGNVNLNIPNLIVFFDQIIGISLGNID